MEANFSGGDLRAVMPLTQERLEQPSETKRTKLPEGLHPPAYWALGQDRQQSDSKEEQRELLRTPCAGSPEFPRRTLLEMSVNNGSSSEDSAKFCRVALC